MLLLRGRGDGGGWGWRKGGVGGGGGGALRFLLNNGLDRARSEGHTPYLGRDRRDHDAVTQSRGHAVTQSRSHAVVPRSRWR